MYCKLCCSKLTAKRDSLLKHLEGYKTGPKNARVFKVSKHKQAVEDREKRAPPAPPAAPATPATIVVNVAVPAAPAPEPSPVKPKEKSKGIPGLLNRAREIDQFLCGVSLWVIVDLWFFVVCGLFGCMVVWLCIVGV